MHWRLTGLAAARLTRCIVGIHVLVLVIHIAAAIASVGGMSRAIAVHSGMAWIVLALGILQALLVMNPGIPRISRMYPSFAAIVVAGELVQLFVVPAGQWAVHVTVAMLVWGCSLAIYIRLLDPQWLPVSSQESGWLGQRE